MAHPPLENYRPPFLFFLWKKYFGCLEETIINAKDKKADNIHNIQKGLPVINPDYPNRFLANFSEYFQS